MSQLVDIPHFINGKEDPGHGQRRQQVFNPATGEATGNLHLANDDDLDRALQVASAAGEKWGDLAMAKRMNVLFEFRNLVQSHTRELAEIITSEHGKVISDAAGEVARGTEVIEFACAMPQTLKGEFSDDVSTGVDVFSFRQPLGVVAGITPFNFPAMVPLWMSPIAIATGNAFVLKPSERDPSASLLLAKLWKRAGLPDGVFQVLHGDKETVDGLLTHELVDGVSFVGSTPVAQHIHSVATSNGKRVQALGGAKNHAVVMPDADLDNAAEHLSAAAFGSAGERCMAISVALAVGDIGDTLVEKLEQQARKVIVGDGSHADSEMGPLITDDARQRVRRIVGEAEEDGAVLVVDGREHETANRQNGFFVGPTLLDQVSQTMSAYHEEIFGPVLVVLRVDSLEEAIEVINSNPYGNGTAIFTGSGRSARVFQRRVTVGMIGVNVPIPVPAAQHSFGGWKDSLFGEHHIYGPDGVRFYTRGKVVTQRWPYDNDEYLASMNFPSNG